MMGDLGEKPRSRLLLRKPSRFDPRDWSYRNENTPVPDTVDLRSYDGPIEDQAELGSCIGFALTAAYEIMLKKEHPIDHTELSQLFVYYNAREIEGTTSYDSGATMRDGLKGIKNQGSCRYDLWPYLTSEFSKKPSPDSYEDGLRRRISKYRSLVGPYQMVNVLANGKPVVIGVSIYGGFMRLDKKNPIVPMPDPYEMSIGGHAMCVVGYDLPKKMFLMRNSYGADWGNEGYCWMTFDYIAREAFDTWTFDILLSPTPTDDTSVPSPMKRSWMLISSPSFSSARILSDYAAVSI